MIIQRPSKEKTEERKATRTRYKDLIEPNRKTGLALLEYLQSNYSLTEILDTDVLDTICCNVTMNQNFSEKLPVGTVPVPKAFYLENLGKGEKFYRFENQDEAEIWGGKITRIFVGIDLSSGFYMVEGSTMLWDELYCFQGLDEKDLQNDVIVAEYIAALQRLGKMSIIMDK